MKNSKVKFSEYMQNISRSKSFGKFVLIVISKQYTGFLCQIIFFNFDLKNAELILGEI